MKQRLSKVEASQELGVSISTIDRMIRRGDLQIEREGTKSNDRVWVILEGEEAAEAGDGASASASGPAAAGADDRDATELREQVKELQGQVKQSTRAGRLPRGASEGGGVALSRAVAGVVQQPPDQRGPNAGAA